MEPENDDAKKIQLKINRLNEKLQKATGTGEDYYMAAQIHLLRELYGIVQYPQQVHEFQTVLENSVKHQYDEIAMTRREAFPKKEKKEKKIESKIALPKIPILKIEDYYDSLTMGDNPFEEKTWEVHWESYNAFSLADGMNNLKNFADEFTPTHIEPQRVPTKKEFEAKKESVITNSFLKLTIEDPEKYGGRYAICYYLQHKEDLNNTDTKDPFLLNINNKKGIKKPILFILKEEKTDDQTKQVKDIHENNFVNNNNNNNNSKLPAVENKNVQEIKQSLQATLDPRKIKISDIYPS